MAKTQVKVFDALAQELYGVGIITEDNPSKITETGLLIINSDMDKNIRISVKTDSKTNLLPAEQYQNQNPALMYDTLIKETSVCLNKNKPVTPIGVPFIISTALKAELVAKNIIRADDITFDEGRITKIDDNNSNVLITYPPKFPPRPGANKSVIGVSIGRNIPLEVTLVKMSGTYKLSGQTVTKTLPVYTSRADGDLNTFVLIDTVETYDDIVDISISLSPEPIFLDGKLRINFKHAYTPARLVSKAELISLDAQWLPAINAITSNFHNDALNNTKSQITVGGDGSYIQTGTSQFLYKMDHDLLRQSWYVKFEPELVSNPSATATIEIGTKKVTINKAGIIAGSIVVGGFYLYEVILDNTIVDQTTAINVVVDYDGAGEDYLGSTYNFGLLVNETQAPDIPLFTFNFLRTRLVVTNENSILYDGYRYIQFKIPLKETSLLLLDYSDKVTTNLQIKVVAQSPNVVDRPSKAEVMDIANLTTDSNNFKGPIKSLWAIDVKDDQPAEIVYQMRIPIGLPLTIGIGIMPVDSKKGYLYHYRAPENDILAEVDPMPGLNRKDDYYQIGYGFGIMKHQKTLMPGMGFANMKLANYQDRILLAAPSVRGTDIVTNLDYIGGVPIGSLAGTKRNDMNILLTDLGYYIPGKTFDDSNKPALIGLSKLPGWIETKVIPDAFMIYRSDDNKLYRMAYDVLAGVPVNMIYKVKLIDLDEIGITADKPLSVNVVCPKQDGRLIEMTDPYALTEEDYMTSIPDYEVTMPSFIHIGDMFGTTK